MGGRTLEIDGIAGIQSIGIITKADFHLSIQNVDEFLTDPSQIPQKQEGPSPEQQTQMMEAQVKQEELKIKTAEMQLKAQKIQQEYQKLAVDANLKQQEINLEREQKRAVAIGAT